MIRPSWDKICMDLAMAVGERSTCCTPNRKIGCVIVTSDYSQVLAWGYNGGARGDSNICAYESNEQTKFGSSRCDCLHAEMNALIKLDYSDHRKKIMYVTLSPCKICAKLIINAGISELIYKEKYRDNDPIFILDQLGVRVREYVEDKKE